MKSHSCEKNRGEGVVYAAIPAPGPAPHSELTDGPSVGSEGHAEKAAIGQCQHIDAQRRRCRMLVASPNENLCPHHQLRQLQSRRGQEIAAAELLAGGAEFNDPESVNKFLGNLVKQVTLKRIPRRDAVTLAYLCQLLLNTFAANYREGELVMKMERVKGQLEMPNETKRPPRVIWDLPHPPYEPDDPVEPEPGNNR